MPDREDPLHEFELRAAGLFTIEQLEEILSIAREDYATGIRIVFPVEHPARGQVDAELHTREGAMRQRKVGPVLVRTFRHGPGWHPYLQVVTESGGAWGYGSIDPKRPS